MGNSFYFQPFEPLARLPAYSLKKKGLALYHIYLHLVYKSEPLKVCSVDAKLWQVIFSNRTDAYYKYFMYEKFCFASKCILDFKKKSSLF